MPHLFQGQAELVILAIEVGQGQLDGVVIGETAAQVLELADHFLAYGDIAAVHGNATGEQAVIHWQALFLQFDEMAQGFLKAVLGDHLQRQGLMSLGGFGLMFQPQQGHFDGGGGIAQESGHPGGALDDVDVLGLAGQADVFTQGLLVHAALPGHFRQNYPGQDLFREVGVLHRLLGGRQGGIAQGFRRGWPLNRLGSRCGASTSAGTSRQQGQETGEDYRSKAYRHNSSLMRFT